jgi:chromosome segregation ATPase
LKGANESEKLADLSTRTYKEQAVWFLNAFWDELQGEAERLWKNVETMAGLDLDKKAEGNAVDELNAHRFLEKFQETMTVAEMRDKLRATGAITSSVKAVPLIHILVFKYKVDWKYLVTAPQGNKEELAKAQAMLDEVSAAFQASEAKAAEAAAALKEAQARESEAKKTEATAKAKEAEAKQREAEAKQREAEAKASEAEARKKEAEARSKEDELRAAQQELEAALAEVKAQEDAYNSKKEELERKTKEGGVVAQNKAKNELAQHLAEDPLPLRRAKITQEAAVKKAEKATAAAQVAADAATSARTAAEAAANQASQARASAEEAARQATQARTAAEEAARQAENARKKSEAAKAAAEAALEEARQRL